MDRIARTRVAVFSATAIATVVVPAGAAYASTGNTSTDSSTLAWWLLGFIALTFLGARILLAPSRFRKRATRARDVRDRREVNAR